MKKKHLSQLILGRVLLAILVSFLILMIGTIVFLCLYERNRIDSDIRFSLKDCSHAADNRLEGNEKIFLSGEITYIDSLIREFGEEYLRDPDLTDYLVTRLNTNIALEESNIIDQNGIIVASSAPENVGFDMHSGKQSQAFLCLLDGNTDMVTQDFMPRSMDGRIMKYFGAPFPEYPGFYLEGYTEEGYYAFKEDIHQGQLRFSRIGREGYFLLVDQENEILCSPEGLYDGETFTLPSDIRELAQSGRIIKAYLFGVSAYVGVLSDGPDYIVAVYPVSEAWGNGNTSILILILILICAGVFALIFVLIHRLIRTHMVRGVYSLNGSLKRITEGDLETKADFRDSLEFDRLSDGINFMVSRLKQQITDAEERIDAELALAAKIQLSSIPHQFPAFPDRNEFDLFARMVPAKEVGGDFYDYFLIDEDHLALIMADVSGKGIPAAMFMIMAKEQLEHSVMKYGTEVSKAAAEANLELLKENDAGLFVTVWLGVVTLSTGRVDYVNAGHEYPAICRTGQSFTADPDVHSAPLAARKKAKFEAGSFTLAPGDLLYLYTDGVTEANDPNEEMFRAHRMLDALNTDTAAPIEEIDANVRRAIDEFVKDAPQFDDTTTLIFRKC